ncbi:hypothetical protein GCM10011404_28110 [Sphingomonas prati]|uniref:IS30 family transposase n=1 Tax=Sphingomonas prati TaxID=1843237 RepID=A0A7W9BUW8_9SPHN|nr:IS30 family transposase [Sphingomonas prati]GGE93506.1 hypothetical protein GCM10011404_28110 [Sphingomonas prati]
MSSKLRRNWSPEQIAGWLGRCFADQEQHRVSHETIYKSLYIQARKLPGDFCRSLTWDRGKELAGHRRFSLATDMAVYFCDPPSPWQRGANENTSRLLRQYLPHGIDLSTSSQVQLGNIARQLNKRPRKA